MAGLKYNWEDRKKYRSTKTVEAVQLLADGVPEGTAFTLTSPKGAKLPATIGAYLVVDDTGTERIVPREELEGAWQEEIGVEMTMGARS